MRNLVHIGIGSNKGNRVDSILSAIVKIENDAYCSIVKISSVYETKPYGFSDQKNFLNAVIIIKTNYTPFELFNLLKQIEMDLGRTDTIKWGPREIDLDILFYNELIYKDENITIPHEGITDRDFVLVPLREIDPEMIHPIIGNKVSEINLPAGSNIINKFPADLLDTWTKKNIVQI